MIQIKLTDKQRKEIEDKHWEWFKQYKAKEFSEKISEDKVLLKYFFNNQSKYNKWKFSNQDNKYDKFKKLIVGDIDKIDKIKSDIDKLKIKEHEFINSDWFKNQYKNFRGTTYKKCNWGGIILVNSLELRTCPYCNRNFVDIYIVGNNKQIKTNAQLDHFFPKDNYPYLAISLYNLIPCCASCNHIKLDKTDEIVYPYSDDINGTMTFKIDFNKNKGNYIDIILGESDDFNIKIIQNKKNKDIDEKVKNNINVFEIDKLYENHKDHVKELIKKASIYDESMIRELYNQYPKLFRDEDEVKEMVFSTYRSSDDFNKRPLSKLNYDISKYLGINI